MSVDDSYTNHAKLVTRMADKVGLDLTEEMQRGNVDSEDLRVMVHKCQGCTDPEHCVSLLESGDSSAFPPEYCRNADTFARLKS